MTRQVTRKMKDLTGSKVRVNSLGPTVRIGSVIICTSDELNSQKVVTMLGAVSTHGSGQVCLSLVPYVQDGGKAGWVYGGGGGSRFGSFDGLGGSGERLALLCLFKAGQRTSWKKQPWRFWRFRSWRLPPLNATPLSDILMCVCDC